MLAEMFSGKHTITPNEDGEYFIDHSPEYFSVILEFYRMRKVFLPKSLSVEKLRETAKYFGLEEEMCVVTL